MVSTAPKKRLRAAYGHLANIPTRWMDNDTYGHVNNVNYYSYFDTAVNGFLIKGGALDIHGGPVIGLVVETHCKYFAPLSFPDVVGAGIAVSKIGTSSVRYEIGLFREGDDQPVAEGYFVHVYVDRASRRPTSLPDELRSLLETIQLGE
jgi:acyl-CoA thioester hydrolase